MRRDLLQAAREVQARSAAGTHINDCGTARCIEHGSQQRGDGGVGAEEIHGALECVGDFLAEEFREPGLFVEFDELYAAHAGLAGEEYEALVRGAAHGLVGMRGSCREM